MVYNNQFSHDTLADIEFRLERIQTNLAGYSAALSLPADILTWGATCSTNFSTKRTTFEVEGNEAQAATTELLQKMEILRSEYQIAKLFATQLYEDSPQRLEGLEFDTPFPISQPDQIQRIQNVLDEHSRMITGGITPVFPPMLITRLQTAVSSAVSASSARNTEQQEASHASTEYKIIYTESVKMLRKLYAWAVLVWGDDHINLIDLGFARSSQMGVGGNNATPDAPTLPYFNGSTTLEWTPVDGASSYGVAISTNGTAWQSDITTPNNFTPVPIALHGKLWYKVRARNANGLGEYSGIFERLFGLVNVQNFAYASGSLTWSAVEFASTYEIERTLGGEAGGYIPIFSAGGTNFNDSPGAGNWTYRIRGVNGGVRGEWVELNVNV